MFNTFSVIRSSVPKLNLDDVFKQKNKIDRVVGEELEKVSNSSLFF